MLTFDADNHEYRIDGEVVPSVTQILGEFVKVRRGRYSYYVSTFTGQAIDAPTFEAGADFGTAVHKACHLLLQGYELDMDALDPGLIPAVEQFKAWFAMNQEAEDGIFERPMYSAKLGVAGTPDIIYPTKQTTRIVDIKTGGYNLSGPQLAAYEAIYREYAGLRANARIERYVLSLPKDGSTFRFIQQTNKTDLDFFKARLYQYNWLRR